ncbi:GGDEF domain-containing protein [Accumulibacter sp.]|jgi:diguanylate cyclase|uniref:GGDEF domain-containing protein n=1 Tax=Accumulibacter sp. TaxID=2053492 RepID=UPI001D66F078|nr:GGDEF domain-containing protein [Accumulibacter sp.]MCB1893481.1 GGDEF domain-containing protein [Rhodocyclaceae bacterium]MCB1957179.1 GGDEF domain-containing protein [Rhodocyclaceae bacterium]MCP5230468.1 GGDEF domain-containing protein [Accumulibacter sp.]
MIPSQTNESEGRDPGARALGFLADHRLASTPVNYWVAYDYLGGDNARLDSAIDEALASAVGLDDFVMREIYDQHVSGESFRRFHGMGEDIDKLLSGLLDDVRTVDRCTSDFRASLTENITRLDKAQDPAGLRTVAQNLLQASVAANASNAALQKDLEATEQEAQRLRNELDNHRREAMTDPLTGLLNRRGMEIETARMFDSRPGSDAAMLVIDIDHFKKVNDTYGHAVGDVVIRKVAETMAEMAPGEAVTARFGGEEFVMLLPGASCDAARTLAEKVRTAIARLRLIRRHDKLAIAPFTISVGVAIRAPEEAVTALFDRADKALYEAKHGGRNRVIAAS